MPTKKPLCLGGGGRGVYPGWSQLSCSCSQGLLKEVHEMGLPVVASTAPDFQLQRRSSELPRQIFQQGKVPRCHWRDVYGLRTPVSSSPSLPRPTRCTIVHCPHVYYLPNIQSRVTWPGNLRKESQCWLVSAGRKAQKLRQCWHPWAHTEILTLTLPVLSGVCKNPYQPWCSCVEVCVCVCTHGFAHL